MSFLKMLGFDPAKHNVRTEILAGITWLLTRISSALSSLWVCLRLLSLQQLLWQLL